MSGWKTWVAAGLAAVSAGLKAAGYEEYATIAMTLAGALGLVGLGHKIEKAAE